MRLYAKLLVDECMDAYVITSCAWELGAGRTSYVSGCDVCVLSTGTGTPPYMVTKSGAAKLLSYTKNTLGVSVHDTLRKVPGLVVVTVDAVHPTAQNEPRATMFDWVYYINLDHRTDRLQQVRGELARMDMVDRATRIPAVRTPEDGAVGCGLSHILALETFLSSDFQTALVLEDDMEWRVDPRPAVAKFLDQHRHWDCVMLAGNILDKKHHCPCCVRVLRGATTAAYAVTRPFAARLLDHWRLNPGHAKNAIDRSWFALQSQCAFYALTPLVALQRASWSDIEYDNVSYSDFI